MTALTAASAGVVIGVAIDMLRHYYRPRRHSARYLRRNAI